MNAHDDELPYKDYIFEYGFGGARWDLVIRATSPEEADARRKAMAWAQYKGELVASIPAVLPMPIMVAILNAYAWVHNTISNWVRR